MKSDKNGVPTLLNHGEQHETFTASNGKRYYQYDYRDIDNQLFSCVKPTLEQCRVARDKWVDHKTKYN